MAKTPQARPALLTINAVLSILIGAAGTLLLGYNFLPWLLGAVFFNSGELVVDSFYVVVSAAGSGYVLIALTILRWGLAVMSDRSTMAYFPGRAARTGRYGAVTGVLTVLATLPVGFFLFIFPVFGSGDPIVLLFELAYLLVVANAVGMIAFASRIDRGSPDPKQ